MAFVRELVPDDLPRLAAVTDGGDAWHGGWDQWQTTYLPEQLAGERVVFVVETEERGLVAYVSLIWKPHYAPFAEAGIPEISDMVVVEPLRAQGHGQAMIAACEARARAAGCNEIGIGFALYADYGRAQRLYVRLGFVPDGRGVAYDAQPTTPGEHYRLDDDLVLFLVKALD
jgi:GNAT superfamily N-acetyltransferase